MSNGGQQIESLLRRISQQQSSPTNSLLSGTNPISAGLTKLSEVSQVNNSGANQQGFSKMIAAMQMLRQSPFINTDELTQQLNENEHWPDPVDVPEPPQSPLDTP
ncbi:MAG: hypothetical protein QNK43_13100 [Amphritea sp.]|nr:hypothetical protein [uncultured Amphritea sp.]MDX2423594.1 hypothetical protein [Amphritea sp.]